MPTMQAIKEHKNRPTKGTIVYDRTTDAEMRVTKVMSNGCRISDLEGIEEFEVTWRQFSDNYVVKSG